MSEQRLMDKDEFLEKMKKTSRYFSVAFDIEEMPTIDPETLPIVQELQTRLGRLGAFLCYATGGKLSGSNYHVEEMKEAFDAYEKEKMADIEKKLSRYEQAEQEGRLVEFPCKDWLDILFGEQEVFFIVNTDYIEEPIREIEVDNSERISWYCGWETAYLKGYDECGNYIEFRPEEVGKTVFLTREEAEAALKEREKDD